MYALVSLWQMPDQPRNRLLDEIEERIAALMAPVHGVLDAYWTYEPTNGKSVAFILLETADQAYDLRNAFERRIESTDAPRIELEMIRVQEIVARRSRRHDLESDTSWK